MQMFFFDAYSPIRKFIKEEQPKYFIDKPKMETLKELLINRKIHDMINMCCVEQPPESVFVFIRGNIKKTEKNAF